MTIRQLARLSLLAALVIAPATTLGQTTASWTQWGGPRRDFMSDSKGLASSWPSGAPARPGTSAAHPTNTARLARCASSTGNARPFTSAA